MIKGYKGKQVSSETDITHSHPIAITLYHIHLTIPYHPEMSQSQQSQAFTAGPPSTAGQPSETESKTGGAQKIVRLEEQIRYIQASRDKTGSRLQGIVLEGLEERFAAAEKHAIQLSGYLRPVRPLLAPLLVGKRTRQLVNGMNAIRQANSDECVITNLLDIPWLTMLDVAENCLDSSLL